VPRAGAAAVVTGALVLAGCVACAGPGGTTRPVSATESGTPGASGTAAQGPPATQQPSATRAASSPPPRPPGAGRLTQTSAFPTVKSTAFRNAMHDLWLAVTTGQPRLALPAFFPEAAYAQVKAIASPQSDWQYRLWYDFTLDVAAAHQLVGRGAKFVKVIVANEDAAWVSPGYCYNSTGYWHLPGARVVYRQGSQLRSFGIASLISWRGDWYVIHFGAVLRSGAYGEVDDPEAGEGYPGPPGGC